MKAFKFCTLLFLSAFINASEPILIMTYVHSRPDFIDLHIKTFNAFLEDDYKYVVFNDAPNDSMKKEIEQTCAKHGVECFRVPDHSADRVSKPGWRHMDAIKFSWEQVGFDYNGIVAMIDADMFLIKPLSIKKYLDGYDLIAWDQDREGDGKKVTYIAPSLVFINMQTIPNKRSISFEGGYIEGLACDVGAHMHYYFNNNPTLKKKLYTCESTGNIIKEPNNLTRLNFNKNDIQFIMSLSNGAHNFEFHGERNFIHHYAGGSNWVGYSATYLQDKFVILNNYIDTCIAFYKNK